MTIQESPQLEIIRGDDTTLTITLTDKNGVAVNLTGATVFFTVKDSFTDDDDDARMSKVVTSHVDPTDGITTVVLTHDDTDIAAGEYYYDLQVVKSDGAVASTTYGRLEVIADITQRTEAN